MSPIRLEVREDPQNDNPMELAEFIMGGRHQWQQCDWNKPILNLGMGKDRVIPGTYTVSSMVERDKLMLDDGNIAMPDNSLGGVYMNGMIDHDFDFANAGAELLTDIARALAVDCPFNLVMPMPNEAAEKQQNQIDTIISQVALIGLRNNMRPNFIIIGDMAQVIRILQLVKQPINDHEPAINENQHADES